MNSMDNYISDTESRHDDCLSHNPSTTQSIKTVKMSIQTNSMAVNRQLNRAAALSLEAPHIAAPVRPIPAVSQLAARVHYQPYNIHNMGYAANADMTIIYQPPAVANPHPVIDQWAHTSVHLYAQFSVTDLPPILFRLEPFRDDFTIPNSNPPRDIAVPMLYEAGSGQQVVNARGDQLRYFSFLPRYVAQDVPGCLLEFWFRLDYRLEMNDIQMRMEADHTGKYPNNNSLNMRRVRFREAIKANAWGIGRSWPVKVDVERLDVWSKQQICLNTTMIVDLPNQRLLKPSFNAANITCNPPSSGNQQVYIDSGVTLDAFLANPMEDIPSSRMIARIVLRQRLQELARIKGLGTHSTAYTALDKNDDPAWWHDKEKGNADRINPDGRPIHEIDNMNHRQFMEANYPNSDFSGVRARNNVRVKKPGN